MTLQEQTPVPILQNEWEFEQLLTEYDNLSPRTVLEIGTFFGGTLYHWLKHGLQEVVCVDLPIEPNDGRYNQMIESRSMWNKWTERFDPVSKEYFDIKIHDIKGNSTDTTIIKTVHDIFELNYDYVDFLFIDGDHSYEGVKSDYENYKDLTRPGSLIVFHDIVGYWTVKKFWDEVKVGKKYKEICNSGPEGWGIGIIYM